VIKWQLNPILIWIELIKELFWDRDWLPLRNGHTRDPDLCPRLRIMIIFGFMAIMLLGALVGIHNHLLASVGRISTSFMDGRKSGADSRPFSSIGGLFSRDLNIEKLPLATNNMSLKWRHNDLSPRSRSDPRLQGLFSQQFKLFQK
jgi:hypothetical protein